MSTAKSRSLSPSAKSQATNLLAFAGLVGVIAAVYLGVNMIMRQDPMAAYRDSGEPRNREGIVMKGFEIRTYQGEILQVAANVDKAIVQDDRTLVTLEGISDGRFITDDGDTFGFEVTKAVYGRVSKAFVVEDGVRITNENLDLKAEGFVYDHLTEQVQVKGPVEGIVNGGTLKAENVVIDLNAGELRTDSMAWVGTLELQNGKLSTWKIDVGKFKYKDGIGTWTDARGQDNDMIISCKSMTYDKKNEIITAEGDVKYFGIDANVSCDKAVIERNIGRAILTSNTRVSMLVKPEDQTTPRETEIPPLTPFVPDEIKGSRPEAPRTNTQESPVRKTDNLRQYPTVIEAGKVDYYYKEGQRRATVTGSPWARQQLGATDWRTISCFSAQYDGEREKLTLKSKADNVRDVRMRNSVGDDLMAFYLVVSTKKDDDEMEGEGVVGTLIYEEEQSGGGSTTGGSGSTTGGGLPTINGPIGRG